MLLNQCVLSLWLATYSMRGQLSLSTVSSPSIQYIHAALSLSSVSSWLWSVCSSWERCHSLTPSSVWLQRQHGCLISADLLHVDILTSLPHVQFTYKCEYVCVFADTFLSFFNLVLHNKFSVMCVCVWALLYSNLHFCSASCLVSHWFLCWSVKAHIRVHQRTSSKHWDPRYKLSSPANTTENKLQNHYHWRSDYWTPEKGKSIRNEIIYNTGVKYTFYTHYILEFIIILYFFFNKHDNVSKCSRVKAYY